MAQANLRASAQFFNQLSLEFQQQDLTLQILTTFIARAVERGADLRDQRLMLILDQAEIFAHQAKRLNRRVEKLMLLCVTMD